jgi:hypothetical protein
VIPTDERRKIVQSLSRSARELDDEIRDREAYQAIDPGGWNGTVILELRRAAGVMRLSATLALQGGMPIELARMAMMSAVAFIKLVRATTNAGVIL